MDWRRAVLTTAAAALSGCAARGGPHVLTIAQADYARAFDLALQASRDAGLAPVLRDRRAGLIETEPRLAGSILEPWRLDHAGPAQVVENTFNHQRRRARFEFTQAGAATVPDRPERAGGTGGTAAFEAPALDLSAPAADRPPLELRVWVYVERAYTPGLRRGTWSRSTTSLWRDPARSDHEREWSPEGEPFRRRAVESERSGTTWTVIDRDPAMEERLLGSIEWRLHRPGG
jgi:hypothetical protein